jgi:multisubunit Na+/H+ antiporter MnhC subunit
MTTYTGIVLMLIGLYGLMVKKNLIKKLSDSIFWMGALSCILSAAGIVRTLTLQSCSMERKMWLTQFLRRLC